MNTLIVFSHLRWDFVYQRPQHLLGRIASTWRVVVVEEPVAGDPRLEESHPAPGVTVLRPHTRADGHGFDGGQIAAVGEQLQAWLQAQAITDYGVWFYTAMAFPLLDGLQPRTVIYDCMDELSAFAHAPPQLLAREEALLQVADVVFTGGPSLYDAKQSRHDNVHCFPSSVDAAHFSAARDAAIASPLFDAIAHPRLGFYGVIDERLDLELVAALADADPSWQVCMVGPVAKIDPASLPRRANLHWLGQQSYEALPGLLAAWDVCLMPFALNESTRFISPTKTLEYMCAGKPVVSTAIADVRRLYADGVSIADDVQGFIAACRSALAGSPAAASARLAAQDRLIEATSWDSAAQDMVACIEATLEAGSQERVTSIGKAARTVAPGHGASLETIPPMGPQPVSAAANQAEPLAQPAARHAVTHVDTLVLGAGPTGLSAAYHLGKDSLLIDANAQVGGWCRSIEDNGFTFDYAGHIMFSNDPYVLELYTTLLGDNLHWQDREAWVFSKGVHTRYPFQGALYGLPPDVLKECIVGAIEARFGALDGSGPVMPPRRIAAAIAAQAECAAGSTQPEPAVRGPSRPATTSAVASSAVHGAAPADCCADGVAALDSCDGDGEEVLPRALAPEVTEIGGRRAPRDFEEFIYQVWGAGVAKHFAVPYNVKLWTVPLHEMETSWLGGRVPMPNLDDMIDGALQPVGKPVGPNARFGYPLHGGFQVLMDGFLPLLEGELRLSTRIVGLQPNARTAQLSDGSTIQYDSLVSTIALPDLVAIIGEQAPEAVHRAAAGLRHVSVRCVNLGIARAGITDKHWIYYPEDTVFHRIFVQGNASQHNNPEGGFGLTCEITYSPTKPLPCDGQELIDRCIAECRAVGMLDDDDTVVTANLVDMPYAYVIYDHARAENVARIRSWLATKGITLAGRYSEWEYYNSDHAFIAGKRAAESVQAAGKETGSLSA